MSTRKARVTLPDGTVVPCERNMADTGWGWLHWVDGVGTCLTVYPDMHLTRIGRGNNFQFTPSGEGDE